MTPTLSFVRPRRSADKSSPTFTLLSTDFSRIATPGATRSLARREIYDQTNEQLDVDWVAQIVGGFADAEMPPEARRLGCTIATGAPRSHGQAPRSRLVPSDPSRMTRRSAHRQPAVHS